MLKTVRRYVKAAADRGLEHVQGPSAFIEDFTASLIEKLALEVVDPGERAGA